jgi:thiol-disulfide isomerase/thioredoxin
MIVYRHRWMLAPVLGLSCLLAASCAAAQEKKEEKKTEKAEEKKVEENPLEKKARKLLEGTAADQKELVALIHKHLVDKGAKIAVPDARLAYGVASALEQLEKRELAAEAFEKFGKDLTLSGDEKIAGFAKLLQGAGRRLGALGKEFTLKGKTMEGTPIDLAKLKGKVVLVDFWATWCGPCVAEIPNIKKMYEKYHAKGFEVVGVSVDEDKDKLAEFLKDKKLPWSSIYDHGAKEGERMSEYYGVMAIPQAILVDQEGKVVALEARGPELGRMLARLLDKGDSEKK